MLPAASKAMFSDASSLRKRSKPPVKRTTEDLNGMISLGINQTKWFIKFKDSLSIEIDMDLSNGIIMDFGGD